MELKDLLNNRLVTPNIETSGATIGFGVVIRANEKNNSCKIKYLDAKNRMVNKDNVQVIPPTGTRWFPSEGTCVKLDISQNEVYIIGEYSPDYAVSKKRESTTKYDNYMDDDDETTGGYII